MRLLGYIRVSRVAGREGDSFISPDQQRDRIEQLARAHGHELVGWHTDLDQSGGTIDRPAFQAALEAVEAKHADGIAVAKLDRFARSVTGAGRALERLEQAGGALIVGDLGMDTSTPAGKLMRNVLMAVAEFELDRIRENILDARDRAIRRGVHISRVPPVGYRRGEGGRLEPDPATRQTVRAIFLRRAAGESWRSLCDWLDDSLPRPAPWSLGSLQGVIRNRVYLGEARGGGTVNPDAHEPLVTRQEWEAAQRRQPRHPRSGHEALLAGVIYCGSCGALMTPGVDGKRGYRRYDCQNRVCPARVAISAPRVETFVEQQFLEGARRRRRARGQPATDLVAAGLAGMAAAEAELAAYRDANLVTVLGQDAYRAGLVERAGRVDEARQQLADAQRRAPAVTVTRDLLDRWADLTVRQRRVILAAALEGVFVERAHLRGQGTPVADRVRLVWVDG